MEIILKILLFHPKYFYIIKYVHVEDLYLESCIKNLYLETSMNEHFQYEKWTK